MELTKEERDFLAVIPATMIQASHAFGERHGITALEASRRIPQLAYGMEGKGLLKIYYFAWGAEFHPTEAGTEAAKA